MSPRPRDPEEEGEFVTESELSVLRALWSAFVSDESERDSLAEAAGCLPSMVERVEALLFPKG